MPQPERTNKKKPKRTKPMREKPENPHDYNYTERRAEIYSLIVEAGLPQFLNQTTLAEHYGKNKSTISRDFLEIGKGISKEMPEQSAARIDLMAESFYHGALKKHLHGKKKNYDKARLLMRDFLAFNFRRGRIPEKPVKIEGEIDIHSEPDAPDLGEDEMRALAEIALERLKQKDEEGEGSDDDDGEDGKG